MRRIVFALVAVAPLAGVVASMAPASGQTDQEAAPIFGVKIPPGYLAWSYDPLEESEKAFGRRQSFVAGPPKNGVQFMVKDSQKYAATDGWGFAQFNDGKPADEAAHNACFSCHAIVKARDFIFNRYAP